jgi:hypothetical protein
MKPHAHFAVVAFVVCLLVALILFIMDAFGIDGAKKYHLTPLGLAFWTIGYIIRLVS